MKLQRMKDLEAEMRKVARGEIAAPRDASLPSVESAEALIRLLTPDNRSLLRTIRDAKPSIDCRARRGSPIVPSRTCCAPWASWKRSGFWKCGRSIGGACR